MTKILNIFCLFVFLVGTFVMSPGARAFDIDHTAVNQAECDLDMNETQTTFHTSDVTPHDCHHCCHYGHAINLSFNHFMDTTIPQKI